MLNKACLLFVGLIALGCTRSSRIEPPIQISPELKLERTWTVLTGDYPRIVAIKGKLAFFHSRTHAGWFDLTTGEPGTLHGGGVIADVKVHEDYFYFVRTTEQSSSFTREQVPSRKIEALLEVPEEAYGFAVDSQNFYYLNRELVLKSVNKRSGKVNWQKRIGKLDSEFQDDREYTAGHSNFRPTVFVKDNIVMATNMSSQMVGLDKLSGTQVWIHGTAHYRYSIDVPVFLGEGMMSRQIDPELIDYETGKLMWPVQSGNNALVSVTDNYVVTAKEVNKTGDRTYRLIWRNRKTGEESHRKFYQATDNFVHRYGTQYAPSLNDKIIVQFKYGHFKILNSEGDEESSFYFDQSLYPICFDKNQFVFAGDNAIYCYVKGINRTLPTDPELLRIYLLEQAKQYLYLDESERETLTKYPEFTLEPLMEQLFDGSLKKLESSVRDFYRELPYRRVAEFANRLINKDNTATVLRYLEKAPPTHPAWGTLAAGIYRQGDRKLATPTMISAIEKYYKVERAKGLGPAVGIVADCETPETIPLLIKLLDMEETYPSWKHIIYEGLVQNGGVAGGKAVTAWRNSPKPMRSWQEVVMETEIEPEQTLAQGVAANGRTFRVFMCSIFGDPRDQFLQEKLDSGWGMPYFVRAESEDFQPFGMKAPDTKDLINRYLADKGIMVDSDKDGLTDLVEKRYGINPYSRDTDGDGVLDAADRCPNAVPRAIGNREKVFEACLEYMFGMNSAIPPGFVSDFGIEPFQTNSYPGVLLWGENMSREAIKGLGNGATQGVNLRTHDPRLGNGCISFYDGGRKAVTVFDRSQHGLNGDETKLFLQKFGNEWFVVQEQILTMT